VVKRPDAVNLRFRGLLEFREPFRAKGLLNRVPPPSYSERPRSGLQGIGGYMGSLG
jgi:hypothetical protein